MINWKKYADSEYDGYKIAKSITKIKNDIKNREQRQDIVMGDLFLKHLESHWLSNKKRQMKNKINCLSNWKTIKKQLEAA